ncbi:MAG: TonB-dependent siderophore receptor, partial [Betaproteobacteria bacterium]|nr:TonB-dependent siderophore receptor [Betaproteobacteria bacterium]
MTARVRFYPVALTLAGLPLGALAAQPETEQQLPEMRVQSGREVSGYGAPTATTATKVDAPLRDIPQTVNVIPEELLRDQAARSMQDALRNVPGIGLSHGDGQRDQVSIRGFSAISDQFIDGLRDDALYFRDLSNIERIEVIKGPAAVLYGRGSAGGLINRITKKPDGNISEVSAQAGSWNQRRGEFDVGRAFDGGSVAFRVTGAIERADTYRDQQFLDREAVAPSIVLKPGAGTQLLLQAGYLSDRRVTDFGIPAYRGRPVAVAPSTYYGAANARDVDYTRANVSAGGFTLTHRIDDDWTFRNAFRGYEYRLDRNNTLVGSVNEAAQTASLNRSNVRRNETGWFNQSELTRKLRLGGMDHQMLYGVEFGHQRKDQLFITQNGVATVSLFNPVLPVLPFLANAAPSTDNVGLMDVASAYVQDLVTLTQHWKALAGVRYDRFEQETRERRAGQPDLSRTDGAWSPRVGVVYQPSLTQSYYASYSKSFQPSAEAFALAANNAQLDPEETTNREIGAKLDFFGGLASATASLFRLVRTNVKAANPAAPTVLIPIGEQRTDGLELAFTGQLPRGWQVYAGYAYLDSRVTRSVAVDAGQPVEGKRATLTPEHSANLWLAKALGGGFGAGGGFNYVDDRAANPGNTVELPAYVTFDAAAWYRTRSYDLQLNLYNLFDREYIVSGHGSSANLNLPGAPRNAVLTARVR